jgi:hypothetical protein
MIKKTATYETGTCYRGVFQWCHHIRWHKAVVLTIQDNGTPGSEGPIGGEDRPFYEIPSTYYEGN